MKVVFHCFGAYVGQLVATRKVKWWPDDPAPNNFPPASLLEIDLEKTPSAARSGVIQPQDIECDDHRSEGGLTGIGPRFPAGQMIGSCWVADGYLARGKITAAAAASPDAYDYESMMTMYFGGELGDRTFNGFHAEIVGQPQGPLSLVKIWNGGTGKRGKPAGRWWLDIDAVSDPNYTTISAKGPQSGALFLDRETTTQLGLFFAKRPAGFGFDSSSPDTE